MDELIEQERKLFTKEQAKYDRLVVLARKIHQPMVVPLWNLKITRADGSIRVDRHSYGHSFTRNLFVAHTVFSLFRGFGGSTHNAPVPDTYGDGGLGMQGIGDNLELGFRADLFPEPNIAGGGYGVPANDTSYGFVAGTGTTAEDFEDFVIEGLITHGGGGGQFSYAAASLVKGWNGGDRFKFAQWTRVMTNSSGGSITVGNIAMYYKTVNSTLCFIHEVLIPSQLVLDTEVLTFTYELRMFFP